MSDEIPEVESESVAPPPPKRRRRWKWLAILLSVFVIVPVVLFSLWSWITLSYTYSSGQRAGWVQKFSEKGWICKTWEGELSMVNMPGQAQERWSFTVRDDSIARILTNTMGNRVALQYDEHRGVPSVCFGETPYYVVGVRHVGAP
jgi:hypothetical protein